MTDDDFSALVGEALDSLPEEYGTAMQNVAVVIADHPTPEQRQRLHLHNGSLLFGLFEGVPKTNANAPHAIIPPSKITVFKLPILAISPDYPTLEQNVRNTVWHEVAHYFGLSHADIDKLEQNQK